MKRSISIVAKAETIARVAPTNIVADDAPLFAHEMHLHLPETRLSEQKGVVVFHNGFIARPWSLAISSSSFSAPAGVLGALKRTARLCLLRLSAPKSIRIEHSAFFPCDEFSNGFFHWFGDVLPRIELFAQTFGLAELRKKTLLIPQMADFPYAPDSLLPYGLTNLHVVKKGYKAVVPFLVTTSPVAPTGNYRPALMQEIRKRFRAHFAPKAIPFRKLFLSRSKAPRRYIANEAALLPVLKANGFERIVIEDFTFPQQVALVAEAKVLVGLHGAGLTNMLWMKEGSKVLEIRFAGDAHNNCYFSLAAALENPYYYLLTEKDNDRLSVQDANAVVDVQLFSELLKKITMEDS